MSQHSKNGFTLIEMMLAMAFVSMLLLAIGAVGIQISQIYHKGLVLNSMDQINRSIYTDLQTAFTGTPRNFTLSSTNYVQQIPGSGGVPTSQTGGGRLCLGRYSYVWNSGVGTFAATPSVPSTPTPTNFYADASGGNKTAFSFAQTYDPTGAMCLKVSGSYPNVPLPTTTNVVTTDLLNTNDQTTGTTGGTNNRSLALQAFTITPGALDAATGQTMYTIAYALGTNTPNTLSVNANGFYTCSAAGVASGLFQFCAVENFTIAARGGYGVN